MLGPEDELGKTNRKRLLAEKYPGCSFEEAGALDEVLMRIDGIVESDEASEEDKTNVLNKLAVRLITAFKCESWEDFSQKYSRWASEFKNSVNSSESSRDNGDFL